MATHLKQKYRQDALACGMEKNSPDTIKMLAEWADFIVVMEGWIADGIPPSERYKVRHCDVGPDRFRDPWHPELVELVAAKCVEWSADGGPLASR